MADPLSITASALTVTAAAIASTKALLDTVNRYKDRDKTIGRLHDELSDLTKILGSLKEAAGNDDPMMLLLKGPLCRCAQICREFEDAMESFSGKSKTGLRDWAKMEFMKGDIHNFIDTLSDYKSTILVGLGTINMHASQQSRKALEEFTEMIQTTTYNLEIRLQRVDEQIKGMADARLPSPADRIIGLEDEKTATEQCIRICQSADSYIRSLQDKFVRSEVQEEASIRHHYEAQVLTQNALGKSRDEILEVVGRLHERLRQLAESSQPGEIAGVQDEISFTKQCLRVCEQASSQVSSQKIYMIGEVSATGNCDQVVVTSLADLFNIGKVNAVDGSAQLIGSMPTEAIQELSRLRYSSRFGAVVDTPISEMAGSVIISGSQPSTTRKVDLRSTKGNQAEQGGSVKSLDLDLTANEKPSPNEVRRRRSGHGDGSKKASCGRTSD